MKALCTTLFLSLTGLMLVAAPVAAADTAQPAAVETMYPYLASGSLSHARVAPLPEGVLLRADGIEIRLTEIQQVIADQPAQVRPILEKNAFYVLEQEAAEKLLARAARGDRQPGPDAKSDDQLITEMFTKLTADLNASEEEQKAFYDENPHYFHGAPFDRIQPQIARYLVQQKKQHFVNDYIRTLGRKMTVEVSETWTRQQAALAADNPLDKARKSGKPTLVLFNATTACCPDTLGPAVADLGRKFGPRLNTVMLNPNTEPILAARYQVRQNPSLVLFGADGKEAFRRHGTINPDDIAARLAALGLN